MGELFCHEFKYPYLLRTNKKLLFLGLRKKRSGGGIGSSLSLHLWIVY